MKWVDKGHEYDQRAKILVNKKNEYFIYGWGIVGKTFFDKFSNEIDIVGIIDRDPQKWGEYNGIPISSPEELRLNENQIVIVATGWVAEVSKLLNSNGYSYGVDYFLVDEFSTIYNFYVHDRLHLENVAIVCNEKCTLRCEKCVALIPYNKHQINYSFEEMCETADLLFKWIDSVGILALSGGDAMLNNNLEKFIAYLGCKYIERIGKIELYTNAIILPTENMINLWRKYGIIVRFTDYSKNVPGRQKIAYFINLCKINNIHCEQVKFDNWVDIGYPQESNGISTEEGLINHCKRCSPVICTTIIKNKLFYCSPAGMSYASGLFDEENGDFFQLDLFDVNKRVELLEFYNGYSEKGYPSYCRRCNGLFNSNDKLIDVAVQLR